MLVRDIYFKIIKRKGYDYVVAFVLEINQSIVFLGIYLIIAPLGRFEFIEPIQ